jgi:hypothetical protein
MQFPQTYPLPQPPVDFRSIPIHIHQIDFGVRAQIISLKPGIHYAVNACRSEDGLREQIRLGLCININEAAMTFADLRRGEIRESFGVTAAFVQGERDILYDLGINPIARRHGTLFSWGALFIDLHGGIQRMVGLPLQDDPYRRGVIHPALYDLASFYATA